MSTVEIVISIGSAAVGAAAGSLAVYLGSRSRIERSDSPKTPESNFSVTSQSSASIPRERLEKGKRELKTLLLEKELVSAALTRLYEAEASKDITKDEREILSEKYRTELKSLNDKISKIDALIQIGDLETLRNQLLQLVNQKMEAIEKRIESTRHIAEPLIAEMLSKATEAKQVSKADQKSVVPDISDLLEKPETVSPVVQSVSEQQPVLPIRSPGPMVASPDQNFAGKKTGDKVEELQRELLEALDRLEKLDVET